MERPSCSSSGTSGWTPSVRFVAAGATLRPGDLQSVKFLARGSCNERLANVHSSCFHQQSGGPMRAEVGGDGRDALLDVGLGWGPFAEQVLSPKWLLEGDFEPHE